MSPIGISPATLDTVPAPSRDPAKAHDAAKQFEALLIGQMLRSARESTAENPGDCATDFAEQQFASVMAQAGGFGLADMIARGLAPKEPPPPPAR